MKKSYKPFVFSIILFMLVVTLILIGAQVLRFKCEELIRQRTALEEDIKSEKSNGIKLIAKYQTLTSEERIAKYAIEELALYRADKDPHQKIIMSNIQVNEVTESLNY